MQIDRHACNYNNAYTVTHTVFALHNRPAFCKPQVFREVSGLSRLSRAHRGNSLRLRSPRNKSSDKENRYRITTDADEKEASLSRRITLEVQWCLLLRTLLNFERARGRTVNSREICSWVQTILLMNSPCKHHLVCSQIVPRCESITCVILVHFHCFVRFTFGVFGYSSKVWNQRNLRGRL